MRRNWISLACLFLAMALLGYRLGEPSFSKYQRESSSPLLEEEIPVMKAKGAEIQPVDSKVPVQPKAKSRDLAAISAGALPGQRSLTFRDRQAMEDFLKLAGDRVKVLDRLDAINSVRIRISDTDQLADLLAGKGEQGFIFPVTVPIPEDNVPQGGIVGLGGEVLRWLGVETNNSKWGEGVKVAVLDTGVADHKTFGSAVTSQNLVAVSDDPSLQNGHGTAVASLIAGSDPLAQGIAPGAEIISIRIADDNGQSDSFLLARGIIAAVDGGAQLINISMGSFGDSAVVRSAIEYANAAGSLIVAASGNNGIDQVSYPAAHPGVVAVGGVDALGTHLNFSNTGNKIDVSAPAYAIRAAWTDGEREVSGTSFSSPIVVGAVAALMSQPDSSPTTATAAYQLLTQHLNDGGAAGKDPALGRGMPDLGRVLRRKQKGIYDAAIGSQRILPPDKLHPNGQIEVLVQNRGTEPLVNIQLNMSTPIGRVHSNITSLQANEVYVRRVPINSRLEKLQYSAEVSVAENYNDSRANNNFWSATYVRRLNK